MNDDQMKSDRLNTALQIGESACRKRNSGQLDDAWVYGYAIELLLPKRELEKYMNKTTQYISDKFLVPVPFVVDAIAYYSEQDYRKELRNG